MQWFYDLKIRTKLILGFSIVAFIAALTGYIGITEINAINDSDTELYENMTVPLSQVNNISTAFQKLRVDIRDAITETSPEKIQVQLDEIKEERNIIQSNSEAFEKTIISDEVKAAFNRFAESRKVYIPLLDRTIELAKANSDSAASALLFGEASAAADREMKAIEELVQLKIKHAKEKADMNTEKADTASTVMIVVIVFGVLCALLLGYVISGYMSKTINQILSRFDSLENICLTNLAKGSDEMAKGNLDINIKTGTEPLVVSSKDEMGILAGNVNRIISKTQETISSVENAVGTIKRLIEESDKLVFAAVNGNLSMRGNTANFQGGYRKLVEGLNKTFEAVVEPIHESSQVLATMSKGDLTVKMTGEYRGDYVLIKESINELSDSMNGALTEVSQAVKATVSAASEISSSSEQMAAGAQEQSQQTSEVASAVEEMTRTILDSNKNTSLAAQSSKAASDSAFEGAAKVEATKDGMQKIVTSTKQTGEKIASLARKTDQIGEIAQVIDDIADQTNLLALNAAIEAARAGEQGRGFAVVADEVRKLAERTTKATKEIADTIRQIQSEAKEADESMEMAERAVEEGMQLTEEVAVSLKQILDVNNEVNDIIGQIAAASEEQSSAAEQISKNIEGISSVTQQSAAGTEQIARAAEDLNRLTVNLQDLVGRFNLSENSHSHQLSYESNRSAVRKNSKHAMLKS